MSFSMNGNKFMRGLLLAIVTGFMFHLIQSGDINLLVSSFIAKIISYSILPFGLISLFTLIYSLSPRKKQRAHVSFHEWTGEGFGESPTHDHAHTYDHDDHTHDGHDHDHDHLDDGHNHANPRSFWSRMTVVLLILALFMGFSWHPVALGTDMIGSQVSNGANSTSTAPSTNGNASQGTTATTTGSSTSSGSPVTSGNSLQQQLQTSGAGMQKDSSKNSEVYIAFNYADNPSQFLGKSETLEGFVYHPAGLPDNYFILTRFYIFCCIADASPIGVAVNSSEAAQLKNNTWVKVTGTLQTESLPILEKLEPTQYWVPKGKDKPVLMSTAIQTIPTPKNPYVIPTF